MMSKVNVYFAFKDYYNGGGVWDVMLEPSFTENLVHLEVERDYPQEGLVAALGIVHTPYGSDLYDLEWLNTKAFDGLTIQHWDHDLKIPDEIKAWVIPGLLEGLQKKIDKMQAFIALVNEEGYSVDE